MGIIQRIVERVHAERPSAEEWRALFVAYSKHVIDMEGTNPLGVFTLPKDTSRALRADILDNIAPELARYQDEVSPAPPA